MAARFRDQLKLHRVTNPCAGDSQRAPMVPASPGSWSGHGEGFGRVPGPTGGRHTGRDAGATRPGATTKVFASFDGRRYFSDT